jgi:hypothetical protein
MSIYIQQKFYAQQRIMFRLFTTFCGPDKGFANKDRSRQNVAEVLRGN